MSQTFYRKYLRQVSAHLSCDRRHKKALLDGFQNELEDRLDGTPCDCYEDLVRILGSPQQVAEELSNGVPFSERCETASKRKRIMFGIIILLVIAVIVSIVVFYRTSHVVFNYPETTRVIHVYQ